MRRATLLTLAVALTGAASAEVRSSSSYGIEKEVLSGGGGSTSAASWGCFSSFAQPQTGQMQATLTARLGFLAAGGGAPPDAPQNLTSDSGDGQMSLDWDNNAEPDLAGYNVYRSEAQGGPYVKVNPTLVMASEYTDTGLVNGTTYYYVVTAVNDAFRESGYSNEASATPSLDAGLEPGVLGGGCGGNVCAFLAALAALALARRSRRS